ncbi:uncharacterized protein LOC135378170 [Ornithodoros turicata]|uniref:uncharacterized protein LOC135378170 n=1 Tax=Ornithodoros turicata TaxID=34597 RepID=UPI003138DF12
MVSYKAALLLLVVTLAVVESRREIKYKIKKQDFLQRYQEENKNRTEESQSDLCHKVALRRCGQNFMKVFNLVEYLSGADYYNAQCTLRKAFFACLDKLRQRPCRKRRLASLDDRRFRKRLADALWETRVCVLGIKDVDELPPKKKSPK